MIVELLVGSGLVLVGAAAARVLTRRRRLAERARDESKKAEREPKATPARPTAPGTRASGTRASGTRASGAKASGKAAGRSAAKAVRAATRAVIEGPRGLLVGDVLLYADTELWLAGMIELFEEDLVGRLFLTPGAARTDWLAQLDPRAQDIALLSATDEVPAGAIPESLPIGGRRLSLERRGDATVRIDGEGLPRTGKRGRYRILSDVGGRVLVVVEFEGGAPRLELVGDRISRHMLDLLPGGDLEG